MKKFSFIFAALFAVSALNAQSNQEEIDFYQSIFGMEKKAAAMEFIHPTEAQAADFWALYDQYETERKALGKKRLDLMYRYAANYATLNDATADDLMKDLLALDKSTNALVVKYFKKIKKKSSPIVGAQFYQLEMYVMSSIRAAVLESVPWVGEMDN